MKEKENSKRPAENSPRRVELQNAKYEAWRKRNPSRTFKDYFAETVKTKLDEGKPHHTLGANLIEGDYKALGLRAFKLLLKAGLKPDDVCVDYGCGTLRIGRHVIGYLRPSAYWGLDIADFLLEEGRKLIGEELWSTKRPNLRVITPQAVAEATAAKPAMVFSFAVLHHVHPQELAEYVGNLMTLIGNEGQGIIEALLNDRETVQYSGRSWVHATPMLVEMFAARGGKILVLNEGNATELEEFGKTQKRCILRVVPA
jgi:hypothetical protein